ncbi:hypothetical protein BKA82DRAFT_3256135 [Pisolithus tinctorius]|nr:hypothetical protein BKA82DRAFT_3256135 [Pisolithus tinctorius]
MLSIIDLFHSLALNSGRVGPMSTLRSLHARKTLDYIDTANFTRLRMVCLWAHQTMNGLASKSDGVEPPPIITCKKALSYYHRRICMTTCVRNNHIWTRQIWTTPTNAGHRLLDSSNLGSKSSIPQTYTRRINGCPPRTHFDWKANSDICKCTGTSLSTQNKL